MVRPASYSGVRVFEILARGVPVMRRMEDAYINATQILRAAGLPKPQRTKILERDVTGGVHEKVQGGYAGFQGTWIPLESARALAQAHGVEADVEELLSYTPKPGDSELPAKEKRKRAPKEPAHLKEERAQQQLQQKLLATTQQTATNVHNANAAAAGNAATLPTAAEKKWTSGSSSHGPSDGMPSSSSDTEMYNHLHGITHPSSSGHSAQFAAPLQYPETPDGRRTTKMALRPPGSRIKRRPLYPGEDDDDAYGGQTSSSHHHTHHTHHTHPTPPASSKKRRQEIAAPGSSSSVGAQAAYNTGAGGSGYSSRSPSMGRSRTPPHAGKRCEGCGVTSTPQWRRGPSGKRTLCNACGVKYSFGRLNSTSGHGSPAEDIGGGDDSSTDSTDSSDEDDNTMDVDAALPVHLQRQPHYHHELPSSPMDSLLLAAAYGLQKVKNNNYDPVSRAASPSLLNVPNPSTVHLELEIKSLKRKLKESERGRKSLHQILRKAVDNEQAVDDSFRQVLHKVAGAGPSSATAAQIAARTIAKPRSINFPYPRYEPLLQQLQQQADDEESEDEADLIAERATVSSFLRRVHFNNRREKYHLGLYQGCRTETRPARTPIGRHTH